MRFNSAVSVKALAFAAMLAGTAAAQTNCCWFETIPAPGVKLLPAGIPMYYVHVTAPITGNVTWTANNYYYLDRDIDVMPGACLTVQPGTWIFAGPYQSDYTSGGWMFKWTASLIIQRGGKAIMKGKPDSVIVMTGLGDDPRDIATLGPGAKGLWGGLIIAGRAVVSGDYGTGCVMEGMAYYRPDSLCRYGGTDPLDSSGVYEYLSVRHGGGGNYDSEIDGISLFAVGSRTVLNHIEVISSYDDGIDFFGGSANIKYLVSAFSSDDAIDLDYGYNGKIQFAFAINQGWAGNRNGEWDGKLPTDPAGSLPSNPTIANMTLIGSGKCSPNNAAHQSYGNKHILTLADSLGGAYRNILIGDGPDKVFRIFKHHYALAQPFGPSCDWKGVMAFNMGGGTTWNTLVFSDLTVGGGWPKPEDTADRIARVNYLLDTSNHCYVADPLLRGISREYGFAALDPRPCAGSPALNPTYYAPTPGDSFFTSAPYVGAFDASGLWCDGWTKLSQARVLAGYLATTPEREIFHSSNRFDLGYVIRDPNAQPIGVSVTFDNIDVTNLVLPLFLANNGTLACGGLWLRAPEIPASALTALSCNNTEPKPAVNYYGLHVIKTTFTLAGGRTLTGYSKIQVIE